MAERKRGGQRARDEQLAVRKANTFADSYVSRLRETVPDLRDLVATRAYLSERRLTAKLDELPMNRLSLLRATIDAVLRPVGDLARKHGMPMSKNLELIRDLYQLSGSLPPLSHGQSDFATLKLSLLILDQTANSYIRKVESDDFLDALATERHSEEPDEGLPPTSRFVMFHPPIDAQDPRLRISGELLQRIGHNQDVKLVGAGVIAQEDQYLGVLGFFQHPRMVLAETLPDVGGRLINYLTHSPSVAPTPVRSSRMQRPQTPAANNPRSEPHEVDLVVHEVPPYVTQTRAPAIKVHTPTGRPVPPQVRREHWVDRKVPLSVLKRMGVEPEEGWTYFVRRGRRAARVHMGDDGSAVNPYDRQIFTAPGSHKDDGHDYGHGAVGARRHNKDGTVVEHKLIGQHPDIPLRDETPPPLLG